MSVAVIGASGFIGTRLVESLSLGGRHTVVPVVRRASSLALSARFALDWRIGDALNASSLAAAIDGCDTVVHVALGDPRQIEAMPAVLGEAAAAVGVRRIVYLSSASVHGQAPALGTTEDTPLHCRHAMDYNNAKVRAERTFFRSCARHGIEGFALRPGIVYGPRSRWIADLASDLRQQRAWLLGAGDGMCNCIYVDNLVDAILQALGARPETAGVYLVGDAERVTWAAFYHRVADALGLDPATIHRLDVPPSFYRTTPDKIASFIASRGVQAILPVAPARLKRIGKQFIAAVTSAEPAEDSWRLAERPSPRITQELALLQQCHWHLSSARARERLGYWPRIDFADAIERSLAWLAFAEGRAVAPAR